MKEKKKKPHPSRGGFYLSMRMDLEAILLFPSYLEEAEEPPRMED
jgi:hypothetical protein